MTAPVRITRNQTTIELHHCELDADYFNAAVARVRHEAQQAVMI